MKPIGLAIALAALLLAGCGEHKSEAKAIPAEQAAAPQTQAAPKAGATSSAPKSTAKSSESAAPAAKGTTPPAAELSAFYRVFKDGANIDPEGKPMLLVFGQSADPYTQKFQRDVAENAKLAEEIRKDVTPIYIDARAQQRHKFMHNGEAMEVDTRTLISIYHIDATPTLIFTDEKGQSIFIVPGYMPPKQFEVTLQFVKEGGWKGKDRKNDEVYEALKAYYEAHGIHVGKKKEGA
ncbi:thioredoxin family protein [Nitratifractor sp.]